MSTACVCRGAPRRGLHMPSREPGRLLRQHPAAARHTRRSVDGGRGGVRQMGSREERLEQNFVVVFANNTDG